jgi:hypothetical protein
MSKPQKPDLPDKATFDWLSDPFAEPAHERQPAGPAGALGFSDQTFIVWERKHDGSFCFAIINPDPLEDV